MKRLQFTFEQYLKRIKRLGELHLGPDDDKEKCCVITSEDNQFFINLLDKQLKFNKNMVITYIILLCLLFSIGVFLVFYHLNSPDIIGIIFGGTFLSLLTVVEKLRQIWREKVFMDITLTVIQELPAKETVKVIETLYWNCIRKPNISKQ